MRNQRWEESYNFHRQPRLRWFHSKIHVQNKYGECVQNIDLIDQLNSQRGNCHLKFMGVSGEIWRLQHRTRHCVYPFTWICITLILHFRNFNLNFSNFTHNWNNPLPRRLHKTGTTLNRKEMMTYPFYAASVNTRNMNLQWSLPCWTL